MSWNRERVENVIDQLIQLEVINRDENNNLRFTPKFIGVRNKCITKLMSTNNFFEELQTDFPNENPQQLAVRVHNQVQTLAIIEMMGGSGKKDEIVDCSSLAYKMSEMLRKQMDDSRCH